MGVTILSEGRRLAESLMTESGRAALLKLGQKISARESQKLGMTSIMSTAVSTSFSNTNFFTRSGPKALRMRRVSRSWPPAVLVLASVSIRQTTRLSMTSPTLERWLDLQTRREASSKAPDCTFCNTDLTTASRWEGIRSGLPRSSRGFAVANVGIGNVSFFTFLGTVSFLSFFFSGFFFWPATSADLVWKQRSQILYEQGGQQ